MYVFRVRKKIYLSVTMRSPKALKQTSLAGFPPGQACQLHAFFAFGKAVLIQGVGDIFNCESVGCSPQRNVMILVLK